MACLYERYWDRHAWDIEVQAALNPLGGGSEPGAGYDSLEEVFNQPAIDATSASGEAFLAQELGVKIKRRAAKKQ